jgi:hypothetical protein
MKVSELILRLQKLPENIDIMIYDGEGPRELNRSPHSYTISKKDSDYTVDCEDREGEPVIVMGYGSY